MLTVLMLTRSNDKGRCRAEETIQNTKSPISLVEPSGILNSAANNLFLVPVFCRTYSFILGFLQVSIWFIKIFVLFSGNLCCYSPV